MKRLCGFLLGVAFLACCGGGESPLHGQTGGAVMIDNLQSKAPAEWKEEPVTSNLRYKQFRLPKVKGDPDDAVLLLFKLGGSADDNVKRWKGMFAPPPGAKSDEAAKVSQIKVGSLEAVRLDVHGTYLDKAPGDPAAKAVRRPSYRMIAVQIEGKTSPYQIRFVGPAKTVEHYKKGFDDWLKGFK